ncbi:MAG TPA: hypothetical protein VFH66_00745 [Mycobacteriales bacterium]|nr:hypothetical protein [Mycobacteriales bacterium]
MTSQFVMTCGECQATHTLGGPDAVVAAEIATFIAAHREHGEFSIKAVAPTSDDGTTA